MKEALKMFEYVISFREPAWKACQSIWEGSDVASDGLGAWYNDEKRRWIRVLLHICLLLSALDLSSFFIQRINIPGWTILLSEKLANNIIYVTETIVMMVITLNIVVRPNYPPEHRNAFVSRAARSAGRFLDFWPFLWVAWFILYMILALRGFGVITSPYSVAFLNLVNNLSGVVMLSMYYELAEKTQFADGKHSNRLWVPTVMVFMVIFMFELIAFRYAPEPSQVAKISSLFSGLVTGVIMSLFAAKFTSRLFVGIPFWAVAGLASYAVLQPVFPLISEPGSDLELLMASIFAMIAFYAKVLLLIVVHWLRDTNRLVYYMVRAAKLHNEEVESNFRAFFERMLEEEDKEPTALSVDEGNVA